MRRFFNIFLLVLLTACGRAAPLSAQPPTGTGGLAGELPQAAGLWPGETLLVYAAPYTGGDEGDGFFMLDSTSTPHAALPADGSFAITGLRPGRYVLVAGPSAEEARPVIDSRWQARLFEVIPGDPAHLGRLELGP